MINVNNWEQRKTRYEQFWQRTNKTPLLAVTAPLDPGWTWERPSLEDKWFNAECFIRISRQIFENTYYGADAYPHVMPSLGPDLLCGIIGQELTFDRSTSWARHTDAPLEELQSFPLNEHDRYYTMMRDFLTRYTEDARSGDYIVGMVDLNTFADGVSSLIGPERMCYEAMDDPDLLRGAMAAHLALYREVFARYERIVTRYQHGTTNWLSIYSDVPWYYISIDFIVMLSDAMYMEFIDPFVRELAAFHPRSFVHLDGEDAARHLGRILAVPALDGVQVQAIPAHHTARLWLPHIHKIQEAGKCVHIEAKTEEDLDVLLRECQPEGLYIKMHCPDADTAKRMEAKVLGR